MVTLLAASIMYAPTAFIMNYVLQVPNVLKKDALQEDEEVNGVASDQVILEERVTVSDEHVSKRARKV